LNQQIILMKIKIPIVLFLSGCWLLLSGCSSNSNKNKSSAEAAQEQTITEPAAVNSNLTQGGIIVYEADGHGLIAATTDIGKYEWTNGMKACDELVLNGYSDWRMPAREELNALYTNLKSQGAGDFDNSSYWSSSEYNNYYAWRQNFNTGRTDRRGNKTKKNNVRPVRSF
jgi:Protein of unknown function (DUF1566)